MFINIVTGSRHNYEQTLPEHLPRTTQKDKPVTQTSEELRENTCQLVILCSNKIILFLRQRHTQNHFEGENRSPFCLSLY